MDDEPRTDTDDGRRRVLVLLGSVAAGVSGSIYTLTRNTRPDLPDRGRGPNGSGLDSDRLRTAGGNDKTETAVQADDGTTPDETRMDAENILDHGGVEGDDSIESVSANVEAIHDASVAAENNTVYLPAGTWYIGAPDIPLGQALQFGQEGTNRGAAGCGFVGDGPRETFLKWGYLTSGAGNTIRYHDDAVHPDTVWKDLTYDGNREAFDIDTASGESLWGMKILGDGDYTFENVRIRHFPGNGIYASCEGDISIDRCTFVDHGIGVANDSGGDSASHHLSMYLSGTSTLSVSNSKFRLASGQMIDFAGGSGETSATVSNCWSSGNGAGCFKINDWGTIEVSSLYVEADTPELREALTSQAYENLPGSSFVHRLNGDRSIVPTLVARNVEGRRFETFVFSIRNGYDLRIEGGSDGPLAFHDIGSTRTYDSVVRSVDGSRFAFDLEELYLQVPERFLFCTPDSQGIIGSLRWDGADEIGTLGNVMILRNEEGGAPFEPVVPSRGETGIESGESG